jgi:glycosyltransferase involved in cell wall biosynthesis
MTRLPISVCLISGAEAERLGRALDSVSGWTSELIVVLNEEVQDGTEAIARARGAHVFREAWKGYLAQKNSAVEKASQEWVFGLDADEVVSVELQHELHDLFSNDARLAPYAAFSFPRLSWYCGRWIRHGDWYPDRKVRLWRREKGRWAGNHVHTAVNADGREGSLERNLLHYSMDGLSDLVRKTMVYSDAFLRERLASGKPVSCFDVWARPLWRFMRGYFFRLGFLDGWQGSHVAWMGAFYTFIRYARVLEAQRKTAQGK